MHLCKVPGHPFFSTSLHTCTLSSLRLPFQGDMRKLTHYAGALASTLDVVREAGHPVELLRKESLAGLKPAAACKVCTGRGGGGARTVLHKCGGCWLNVWYDLV